MASKNYLDRGGLEHTWAKIKSWIQTYLSSWKTTNFGSGTINNTGSISNSGDLLVNSDFELGYEDSEVIIEAQARTGQNQITINKGHGIKVVRVQNNPPMAFGPLTQLYARNNSGVTINVTTVKFVKVNTGTSEVPSHEYHAYSYIRENMVANAVLAISETYNSKDQFFMLVFW